MDTSLILDHPIADDKIHQIKQKMEFNDAEATPKLK